MARRWLIDGYNVLHQTPRLKFEFTENATQALNHFVGMLGEFAVQHRTEVTVVFDGSPPEGPGSVGAPRNVTVRFVGSGEKADPVIKRLIGSEPRPRDLVVVSADREITDYARVCGAKVEGPADFQRILMGATSRSEQRNGELLNKYDRPLSEREVQEWLDLFEQTRDEDV